MIYWFYIIIITKLLKKSNHIRYVIHWLTFWHCNLTNKINERININSKLRWLGIWLRLNSHCFIKESNRIIRKIRFNICAIRSLRKSSVNLISRSSRWIVTYWIEKSYSKIWKWLSGYDLTYVCEDITCGWEWVFITLNIKKVYKENKW